MQTLSLFSTPLLVNKQAPTFKASAVSEGVSTFTAPSRLQQDTVSFSATPKIRSGTVAPSLEGELSSQQEALIKAVIEPYPRKLTSQKPSLSIEYYKELLTAEFQDLQLDRASIPSFHLQYLPEAYQTNLAFSTISKDHDALKPYQIALEKAKKATPEMPSDTFFNALPLDLKEKALLILSDPEKLSEAHEFISYLTLYPTLRGASRKEASNYSIKYLAYLATIQAANEKLLREKNIQERLVDFDVFTNVAQSLGLGNEYSDAFRKSFAPKGVGKLPFSPNLKIQRHQYEAILRQADIERANYFSLCFGERPLSKIWSEVYFADRKKKVEQVLGLLEKSPEAVKAVIEELRCAKP